MAKGRAAAIVAAVTKVTTYARENPEKAAEAIGKVEDFVRSKAGPQHGAKVTQGADALRKGLGLPATGRPVPPPPAGSGDPR